MVRVALLTLYPLQGSGIQGGVRAVTRNLVEGLKAYPELEIDVVHCHSDASSDAVVRDGNVTVHYLSQPRAHLLPNILRAAGQVRAILREIQPDVVNAHLSHFAVAAMREYPTVWTIHGVAAKEAKIYNQRFSDRLRHRLITHNVRQALRRATDIIAISPYVIEEYGHLTKARWHRIDNPIPETFFELANRERFGRILFPGSIDELKNALDTLRALPFVRRYFPDVELHIAGRVKSPSYERTLHDYIRDQHLEDTVLFRGLLDQQQMRNAYAECSMAVLTSRQENQPMAVIEAMAAAKPVIATRVGGVPDLICHGQTGFIIDPGDVGALGSLIVDLLSDEGLRKRIGQEARQAASARFRVSAVAAKYVEVFEGVLRDSRGQRPGQKGRGRPVNADKGGRGK